MTNKYQHYINTNFPTLPRQVQGQCVNFCKQMNIAFPELEFVFGCVESENCADNISYNGKLILKQFPHAWLLTSDGKIIDPTLNQFINLPNLKYVRFRDGDTYTGSCYNCGRLAFNKMPTCHDHDCQQSFCEDWDMDIEQYKKEHYT